ncbi:MAG TPA: type IV toxin-antitoxin system AbiEi family antitoxin domain-containing protein [Conexibacter sp.]
MARDLQVVYLRGTQLDSHRDGVAGAIAARQHGVVTRGQLLDAGLTSRMVQARVASGQLLPLHRGVYAVGHAQLRLEGRWLAAALAAGPGAVLSHRSAAALHGLRESEAADVTTTRRVQVRGVVIHRTTALGTEDLTTRRGVRVTTVARTLVDLAAILPPAQTAKLLRETDRLGRLNAAALEAALERAKGRGEAGRRALRAALEQHQRHATSLTRSELEDRFLALLAAEDLPRPLTNHLVLGMKVDAVWPEHRLAVELDGWAFHHDRASFEEDRARSARLTIAGWTPLRFTHAHVVEHPAEVAATLRALLAR